MMNCSKVAQQIGFMLLAAIVFRGDLRGEVPSLVELSSPAQISLSEVIDHSHWKNIFVRETRATSDGVWAWIVSKEQVGASAIVKVGYNSRVHRLFEISDALPAGGFGLTSRGVAVVVRKQNKSLLREYDPSGGALLTEIGLPCVWNLVTIGGKPSTICQDGAISVHNYPASPVVHSSWARPGSLVEPLSERLLAIVDQASAESLVYNLETSVTTPVHGRVPEIEEALRRTSDQRRSSSQISPPDGAPLGRPIIAMDSAADSSGWYVLIWPYHGDTGPAVARFDSSGQLLARLRCRVPASERGTWHKIEVAGGYLILVSTTGNVLRYRL